MAFWLIQWAQLQGNNWLIYKKYFLIGIFINLGNTTWFLFAFNLCWCVNCRKFCILIPFLYCFAWIAWIAWIAWFTQFALNVELFWNHKTEFNNFIQHFKDLGLLSPLSATKFVLKSQLNHERNSILHVKRIPHLVNPMPAIFKWQYVFTPVSTLPHKYTSVIQMRL